MRRRLDRLIAAGESGGKLIHLVDVDAGGQRQPLDASALQHIDELHVRERSLAESLLLGDEIVADDEKRDAFDLSLLYDALQRRDHILHGLDDARMIRRIQRPGVDCRGDRRDELLHRYVVASLLQIARMCGSRDFNPRSISGARAAEG